MSYRNSLKDMKKLDEEIKNLLILNEQNFPKRFKTYKASDKYIVSPIIKMEKVKKRRMMTLKSDGKSLKVPYDDYMKFKKMTKEKLKHELNNERNLVEQTAFKIKQTKEIYIEQKMNQITKERESALRAGINKLLLNVRKIRKGEIFDIDELSKLYKILLEETQRLFYKINDDIITEKYLTENDITLRLQDANAKITKKINDEFKDKEFIFDALHAFILQMERVKNDYFTISEKINNLTKDNYRLQKEIKKQEILIEITKNQMQEYKTLIRNIVENCEKIRGENEPSKICLTDRNINSFNNKTISVSNLNIWDRTNYTANTNFEYENTKYDKEIERQNLEKQDKIKKIRDLHSLQRQNLRRKILSASKRNFKLNIKDEELLTHNFLGNNLKKINDDIVGIHKSYTENFPNNNINEKVEDTAVKLLNEIFNKKDKIYRQLNLPTFKNENLLTHEILSTIPYDKKSFRTLFIDEFYKSEFAQNLLEQGMLMNKKHIFKINMNKH